MSGIHIHGGNGVANMHYSHSKYTMRIGARRSGHNTISNESKRMHSLARAFIQYATNNKELEMLNHSVFTEAHVLFSIHYYYTHNFSHNENGNIFGYYPLMGKVTQFFYKPLGRGFLNVSV